VKDKSEANEGGNHDGTNCVSAFLCENEESQNVHSCLFDNNSKGSHSPPLPFISFRKETVPKRLYIDPFQFF